LKKICASSWAITKNHCMMHGQQNVIFYKNWALRPVFDSGPAHVRFVVDEEVLGRFFFFPVFRVSRVTLIPPIYCTHVAFY